MRSFLPGSGCSPRPPSRTSASRIPLPLRSSSSPFNAAMRGEKEDSLDRFSVSSSASDAGGVPVQMTQPPPYGVTAAEYAAAAAHAHVRPDSTTAYLMSRYGAAAAAAEGTMPSTSVSGRYGSYTIYHNPSSHLPPHTSHDYSGASNPGSRSSYAGTSGAKTEYFRGSYPTHYGTSTTVGEDGTMVVGQIEPPVSPRWRRRSYDYEAMEYARAGSMGPPQTAVATVRTTGNGRPLSELASGISRSRSRSRVPQGAEYDHSQHPPPPSVPPPASAYHHRYVQPPVASGPAAGYRPANSYMYAHSAYAGYHIPQSGMPTGDGQAGAGQGGGGGPVGHMEPHPPPAYSRSDREISARLRRYHQQPNAHS